MATQKITRKTPTHGQTSRSTNTCGPVGQESVQTKSRIRSEEVISNADAMINEIDTVLDVEVDKSQTLKLSDLMRIGAKEHPQAIGAWRTTEGDTCALTAALDGAKSLGLV